MIRCQKGHYYDENKYMFCPYCGIYDEDDDVKTQYIHAGNEKSGNEKSGNEKEEKQEKKAGFFRLRKQSEPTVKTISGAGLIQNNYVAGWLVCIKGEDRGRDYRIYRGNNFLGRDYGMDIRIENDESVSRKNHCSIIYEPRQGKFYVKPMENMVYIDGKLLGESQEIVSGQEMEIGNSTFVFIAFCGEARKWEE